MIEPRVSPLVREPGLSLLQRLGLLIYSAIFASGGWTQLTAPGPRGEQARRLGLPVSNEMVQASGIGMIAAALALQIGPLRRPAATILALQLVPVTFVGHRFWDMEPGSPRNAQRIHFMKNLSLIGAALYVAAAPTLRA